MSPLAAFDGLTTTLTTEDTEDHRVDHALAGRIKLNSAVRVSRSSAIVSSYASHFLCRVARSDPFFSHFRQGQGQVPAPRSHTSHSRRREVGAEDSPQAHPGRKNWPGL